MAAVEYGTRMCGSGEQIEKAGTFFDEARRFLKWEVEMGRCS